MDPEVDTLSMEAQYEIGRYELAPVNFARDFRVGFDRMPRGIEWHMLMGEKTHERFRSRYPVYLGLNQTSGGQFFKYVFVQEFIDGDSVYQYKCVSRHMHVHSVLVRKVRNPLAVEVTETEDDRTPGNSMFVARLAFSGKWLTAFVSPPEEDLTTKMAYKKAKLACIQAGIATPFQQIVMAINGEMPDHTEILKHKAPIALDNA